MRILNRRARRDYEVMEEVEAGVVLSGAEVKSLRGEKGNLTEAFVRIKDGEVWLHNMVIPQYSHAGSSGYDPGRGRKLLLHRREILALQKKMEGRNLTLVPLACYTTGRYVKVKIGLARGRKKYEKRELKKRQDIDREVERALKDRY